MLVYEDDSNVLAVSCEAVKGLLDRCGFRLVVDDEVVLLRVGGVGDVLCGPWYQSGTRVGGVTGRIGGVEWLALKKLSTYTNTGQKNACHRVLGKIYISSGTSTASW